MDYSPLKRAGLRPIDLAEILGTSRINVMRWMQAPDKTIQPRFATPLSLLLPALARQIEKGALPRGRVGDDGFMDHETRKEICTKLADWLATKTQQ